MHDASKTANLIVLKLSALPTLHSLTPVQSAAQTVRRSLAGTYLPSILLSKTEGILYTEPQQCRFLWRLKDQFLLCKTQGIKPTAVSLCPADAFWHVPAHLCARQLNLQKETQIRVGYLVLRNESCCISHQPHFELAQRKVPRSCRQRKAGTEDASCQHRRQQ